MTKELTIEKKDVTCPHCLRESSEVIVCEWVSSFSTHLIYFCIHCNKQISISHTDREKVPEYAR